MRSSVLFNHEGRGLVFAFTAVLLWWPLTVLGQPGPCDADLVAPVGNPHHYQLRESSDGERCEGIYAQDVVSADLSVQSFIAVFEAFDLGNANFLTVHWRSPLAGTIRIRASAVRAGTYYRLDAIRSAERRSLLWPTNILKETGLGRDDLGILGWFEYQIDGSYLDVHMPVSVRQTQMTDNESYTLTLVPNRALNEIMITISHLEAVPGDVIWDRKSLRLTDYEYERKRSGLPPYRAGQPVHIEIPLDDLTDTGIHIAEITVAPKDDDSDPLDFLFYHERNSTGQ